MDKVFIVVAMLLSSFVSASDISDFSVRGVKVGVDPKRACRMLAADFPFEEKLNNLAVTKLGKKISPHNVTGIDKYRNHRNGCSGGFTAYDKSSGLFSWSDSIDVSAKNGLVYKVKNKQKIVAGNAINECHAKRENIMDSLKSKYGDPTYTHSKGRNPKDDFRHLIWDYSSLPSAQSGDEEYELYQVHLECEISTKEHPFSMMVIQTEINSGQIIKKARELSTTKITKTIQPSL